MFSKRTAASLIHRWFQHLHLTKKYDQFNFYLNWKKSGTFTFWLDPQCCQGDLQWFFQHQACWMLPSSVFSIVQNLLSQTPGFSCIRYICVKWDIFLLQLIWRHRWRSFCRPTVFIMYTTSNLGWFVFGSRFPNLCKWKGLHLHFSNHEHWRRTLAIWKVMKVLSIHISRKYWQR